MGNASAKETKGAVRPRGDQARADGAADTSGQTAERPLLYGTAIRPVRSGRHDLAFFGLADRESSPQEHPRETRQEREARRLEKDKAAREQERDRSLKEEQVDGGFLVTLGTYTGPEDFSKPAVRQFQIERRLAPFWKGLEDHKDSWTELQLVAAVRGLPIPAADVIPPELERSGSDSTDPEPRSPTEAEVRNLTLPIASRSTSNLSDNSMSLSPSHPAFSTSSPTTSPVSINFLRGRAKTLASLTLANRSNSNTSLVPKEIQLPRDGNINGQPVEAYLYKDAAECPICFLFYPPFLNKTRCCDQAICSECFVQIKRPDPHPPEHHDDPTNPNPQPKTDEDNLLVSEPSACPYCAIPEFGVTYEPPPFRRGLAYGGADRLHTMASAASAMSSQTSLGSMGSRRRTTSLSVNDKSVITTDKVRPDWAKKLADARALALRRSAAATALHNAAYMLGSTQNIDLRSFRRRRFLLEPATASGGEAGTDSQTEPDASGAEARGVRRGRVEDLEDLMMMEAIRLSLAAEEERQRREEKEAAKDAKKRAKQEAKDAKKAEKAARKSSKGSLYSASANQSTTSTWATTSLTRSTSQLGYVPGAAGPNVSNKGKAPAAADESTSWSSRLMGKTGDAQKHLEDSRANLNQPTPPISLPIPAESSGRGHKRQLSVASSVSSSMLESAPGSYQNESTFGPSPSASGLDLPSTAQGAAESSSNAQGSSMEPMFNFRSLAAMIGENEKEDHESAEHYEDMETPCASKLNGMTGVLDLYMSDGEEPTAPIDGAVAAGKEAA